MAIKDKDNSSIHQIQGTCILVYANTPKPVFNGANEPSDNSPDTVNLYFSVCEYTKTSIQSS